MLKAGDKVKFKEAADAKVTGLDPNGAYTVNEINKERRMVQLVGVQGNFYISRFVLAEEPVTPEPFQVGDTIQYTEGNSMFMKQGSIGTILSLDKDMVFAKWDDGEKWYAEYDNIKKYVPEPAKEPKPSCPPEQNFNETMKKAFKEALLSHAVRVLPQFTIYPIGQPPVTRIMHNGITTITHFADGTKMVTRPSADDVAKYDPFVGWCVGVIEKLYGGKKQAKDFYAGMAETIKAANSPIKTPPTAPLEPSEARKQYDKRLAKKSCLVCVNDVTTSNTPPCMKCWNEKERTFEPRKYFQAKFFQE